VDPEERAWQTSAYPERMLTLHSPKSDRKGRLLLVAYCREMWDSLSDGSRFAVTVAERWADGLAGADELEEARFRADEASVTADGVYWQLAAELEAAEQLAANEQIMPEIAEIARLDDEYIRQGLRRRAAIAARGTAFDRLEVNVFRRALALVDRHLGASLLRCIFGNPFRPVTFDMSWRSSSAVGLARTMYESRDFGAMPILADALEEAGCDRPDVLAHCRADTPHVRGCWVVDLVLGKS
jgi:hypothetical protein